MKRIVKVFSILLSLVLVLGTLSPSTAKAAEKASIWPTDTTISIGTQKYSNIEIENKNSGAKYTYSSSNEKIVKVSSKGVLTGVSAGTAKITVKQILKKKTTTVGVCKVTVKKSIIIDEGNGWLVLSKAAFSDKKTKLSEWDLIAYAVPSATYSYYSNDTSRLVIKKDGTIVETKKTGKVSVTIKETYKKKTRTVGKYTIDVKAPELTVDNNVMDIAVGETFSIYSCYNYYAEPFYVDAIDGDGNDDNDALEFILDESGSWTGDIKGVREGSMTVSFYLGKEKDETKLLGNFTVNVKKFPATAVTLDEESVTGDLEYGYDYFSFSVDPYNCTDTPVITSSDSSIASIDADVTFDQLSSYKEFKVNYHKAGTVTITIKVGSITKVITLTVTGSEEVEDIE